MDIDYSVIKTLAYFDVFQYPLKVEEVYRFIGVRDIAMPSVQESLDRLEAQACIYRMGKFYSLQSDDDVVRKRLRANEEAAKWLPVARQKAIFIFRFPFVRAVMASGSLSKNCMDENSDLDFFIITAKNRLWVTRLMLTLYKKLFLGNSHKLFCINYYLTEDHLALDDHNLFTATELTTLIPLAGPQLYNKLQGENATWTSTFLPNTKLADTTGAGIPSSTLKQWAEKIISIIPASFVEALIMRVTHNRWKRLYESSLGPEEFCRAFRSTPNTSKAHPRNFQKKVMERYAERLKLYSKKLELQLV